MCLSLQTQRRADMTDEVNADQTFQVGTAQQNPLEDGGLPR